MEHGDLFVSEAIRQLLERVLYFAHSNKKNYPTHEHHQSEANFRERWDEPNRKLVDPVCCNDTVVEDV